MKPGNERNFAEITSGASDCLKNKLLRAEGTIRHYHVLWRRVQRYMESKKIRFFTAAVGKKYLLQEFGERDYDKLSKREKDLFKAVSVLCEFENTGSIQPVKEQLVFEGEIGQLIARYLSYRITLRLSKHTIDEGAQHLFRFICYLNEEKVTSIKTINQLHILQFLKTINSKYSTLVHLTLQSLRGFFSYLYEQQVIEIDLSSIIPKDNYKKQPKLPSSYTATEIETMVASIDRGNSNGKRNYAIVLLAARLGLRASDIANLKFDNLLWEQCSIVLNQYKTGKKIELPILQEVGNALIDYLKYGRPKSSEQFIFLLSRSPFAPIHSCSITGIVHSSLMRAGINIDNRKHGPHSLRHSLAGILLEKEVILPVISEVLGHENTESTKYYLRIDLKSMRQCILEVPSVPSSFYEQKGGYFYA